MNDKISARVLKALRVAINKDYAAQIANLPYGEYVLDDSDALCEQCEEYIETIDNLTRLARKYDLLDESEAST